MTPERKTPNFSDLLTQAIHEPGTIHAGFRAFHNYSFGNQLLALSQCHDRGIPIGPIASYQTWREKGRQVRKGEKAIILCRPVVAKRTTTDGNGNEDVATFTRFIFRAQWFALAQTDGPDVPREPIADWDLARALATLSITEKPFDLLNGNVWGYAHARTIAINPVAPRALETAWHEIAHILLGHTGTGELMEDGATLGRNERELEAESVAYLVAAALGREGLEYSRGYIQNWWGAGNPIPERTAQRILKITDQILKAGTAAQEDRSEAAAA